MPKESSEIAAIMPENALTIRPGHRRIVCAILRAVLPEEAAVYVFGSRARGTAKKAADLDLAIDARRKLTLQEEVALSEKFEDSDLPYKVDIVDLRSSSAAFGKIVKKHYIPFPLI